MKLINEKTGDFTTTGKVIIGIVDICVLVGVLVLLVITYINL